MVTIREIARKSGYSQATVSRLLNGDPTLSVREATRRRIIEASEELGYTAGARRLSLPRKVAMLDDATPVEELQDAYFDQLRETLERHAKAQNMELVACPGVDDMIAGAGEYDGFIAIGPEAPSATDLTRLHELLPNGVFVDINPAPNLFDSVRPDLSQTILDALDALTAAGMRRIGFIGGVGESMGTHRRPEDPRLLAFREWSARLGVDCDGLVYADGPFTVDTGRDLAARMLADHADDLPDAVIVAADPIAVGVLQACAAAGVRVPHDMALVSINDQTIARYTSPPLTTFAIDLDDMASSAITMLAEAIADRRRVRHHLLVSTSMTVRGSFVPAR